jgi:hypothetical protein
MMDARPLNTSGTYTRTSAHEVDDRQQAIDNITSQAWKSWPNEAGVRSLYFFGSRDSLKTDSV